MPRHGIQRRMIDIADPQITAKLGDHFKVALAVFEGCDRRQKVARIGQTVGSDRSEIGQSQRRPEVFAHISSRRSIRQVGTEFDPPWNDRNLTGHRFDDAHLGHKAQQPLLGHKQHFAVGIVEIRVRHGRIGAVDMDAHTGLAVGIAIAGESLHARDQIGIRFRNRHGVPAHLLRRQHAFTERRRPPQSVFNPAEFPVPCRWAQPVHPSSQVIVAGLRKGGAAD